MAKRAEIRVRREGIIAVIQAPGYINKDGGEQVAAVCDGLIEEGVITLVLNLEQCNMVNSVGVSYLIEVLEKVTEAGGKMAFNSAARTVAKTLQIMGLLQKASLHDTEADAVAAMSD